MFEEKFLGWTDTAEVTRQLPRSVEDQRAGWRQPWGAWACPIWEAITALLLFPVPPSWSVPGVCHQVILGVGAGVCDMRSAPRTEHLAA